MTQTQAIAKNKQAFENLDKMLSSRIEEIKVRLPNHGAPGKLMAELRTVFLASPALVQCTPKSIIAGVYQIAELGLDFRTTTGHAYLVPFNQGDQKIAQVIIGYRGYAQLGYNSGRVADMYAKVVREGDTWDYVEGTSPNITHKPNPDALKNKILAAYAVIHTTTGGKIIEWVWGVELEDLKARQLARVSKPNASPWSTSYEAMCRKTPLRRGFKYAPVSPEVQTATTLDDLQEAGIGQDLNVRMFADSDGALLEAG